MPSASKVTYFSDKPILSSVLIGREREMELLERALVAAQGGTGQCVILTGEAGIGKSRLVAELSRSATTKGSFGCGSGRLKA